MKHRKSEQSNMHVAWKSMLDEAEARIRINKDFLSRAQRLGSLRRIQSRTLELKRRIRLLLELRALSKEVAYSRWEKRAAIRSAAEKVRKVPRRAEASRR